MSGPHARTGTGRRAAATDNGGSPTDPVVGATHDPVIGIGELVAGLRADFPDISVSKVRYLEAQGLIEPERTPSGYRRFRVSDIDRLRFVLTAQRENFLPLKVIRRHLAAMDRGLEQPSAASADGPRAPADLPLRAEPDDFAEPVERLRLTRAELADEAGLDGDTVAQLEAAGLVVRRSGHYDADALAVCRAAAVLRAHGVEPRHLRPYKTAADRELGLIHQASAGSPTPARADVRRTVAAASARLHLALLRAGLR